MAYYDGIEEIEREPLTKVAAIAEWLAEETADAVIPAFIPGRSVHSTLDDCDLGNLAAIALDQGLPDALRVRAMNKIGDAWLAKLAS